MSRCSACVCVAGTVVLRARRRRTADPVADFYKGKQIRFVVRTTVGGDYDQYSRLLARFMGKHIPGNPPIVVVNMPGGGGITAANYMAQVAPRDGTVIGIVSQGLAADQALGMSPQLKADLREFNWIANVVYSNQLLVVWHTSPTKTIEDAKKPRHHHRHHRRGLGLGAISGVLQQRARHQIQDRVRLSGRPAHRSRDGARRGRRPRHQSLFGLDGVEADVDSAEADHSADPGGRREGAGAAGRAADRRSAGQAEDKPLLHFMAQASTRRAAAGDDARRPGRSRGGAARGLRRRPIKDPEFIAAAKQENMEIRPHDRREAAARSSSACSMRRRTCATA